MKQYLGQGGVGDCFIVILKLLEQQENDYIYHHLNTNPKKLKMCGELLRYFNINYQLLHCKDNKHAWNTIKGRYDSLFNMYAAGKIDVPSKDQLLSEAKNSNDIIRINLFYMNHWQSCIDKGLSRAFPEKIPTYNNSIVVQPIGGLEGEREDLRRFARHWKHRPIIKYIEDNFDTDNVVWVGSEDFTEPFGTNLCGKLSFSESLDLIAESNTFVGFNSILLYWSLYNKKPCHLFMDFQNIYDTRIHNEWKEYITWLE